jgi:hypothetical protein
MSNLDRITVYSGKLSCGWSVGLLFRKGAGTNGWSEKAPRIFVPQARELGLARFRWIAEKWVALSLLTLSLLTA